MNILEIATAAVWVDFITIVLSKFFDMGRSLDVWYKEFGIVAVISDCLVIILGILIAQIFFPKYPILITAIVVQLVHDILFYLLVINNLPIGQNRMIDLFKAYSSENSWKILAYDSTMIGATVMIAQELSTVNSNMVSFIGLLGIYSMTYIIYTR
jgi:hypothetical protein